MSSTVLLSVRLTAIASDRSAVESLAVALKEMGYSHAFVSTPRSNVGAVATYRAAGYQERPQVRDLRRPA